MAKHLLFMNATYPHKLNSFLTAKDLGMTVSVVGPELPDWVRPYVDQFIEAQTSDINNMDAALDALRQHHAALPFDGVVTFWDHGVVPTARVASELGLPGSTVAAADGARNKYKMREALRRHGVAHPAFARVQTWDELQAAAQRIGYPLILKPTGGAGSAGVSKIESPEQLEAAFDTLMTYIAPENHLFFSYYPYEYIAEEYMQGRELSVEGIVADGVVHMVGVTEKWITPSFAEYQHAYPARIAPELAAAALRLAEAGVKAVGLDNCGVHVEVMATEQGCKIVEINGRLGGDFITSHLVPVAQGSNMTRALLQAATSQPFDLAPQWHKGACIRFLIAEREGTVESWQGLERLEQLPGIVEVGMDRKPGDTVLLPPKNYFDLRLGYIITEGKTTDQAIQRAEAAASVLRCVIV